MNHLRSTPDSSHRLSRRQMLAGLLATPVLFSACGSIRKKSAARSLDVIVIGAGAIGCNTAWHLRQRGLRVLALEARPQPASQSTGGAAGFVAAWAGISNGAWKKNEWEMERYGIDFYTRLAQRTKADIGFSPCGITYIYTRPDTWKNAQRRIEPARQLGTTAEILTADRARELTPFLEFGETTGIIFDPDAIRIRAGDAIGSLAAELARDGVRFQYDTRVTDFLRDGNRIAGVRTAGGDLHCEKIIVTAGAWSRPLLAKLGVACPSEPFNETRFVSKPLPGLPPGMPLLILPDVHNFYIREEKGGLLIGGGSEGNPLPQDCQVDADNPPWCDQLPPGKAHRMREFARQSARIMPVLAQAEIATIRSGIPTTTKDRKFIAGPVPGVAGLFVMSGCQEAGVTHGPALGRILAEHVVDGKTHWDSSGFRLERFAA